MLLGQLGKKVQAARQADRHKHHDQVPGDVHRGGVHEWHPAAERVADASSKFVCYMWEGYTTAWTRV
jgi:hypothetical protein